MAYTAPDSEPNYHACTMTLTFNNKRSKIFFVTIVHLHITFKNQKGSVCFKLDEVCRGIEEELRLNHWGSWTVEIWRNRTAIESIPSFFLFAGRRYTTPWIPALQAGLLSDPWVAGHEHTTSHSRSRTLRYLVPSTRISPRHLCFVSYRYNTILQWNVWNRFASASVYF